MAEPAPRPTTYAELEAVPPHRVPGLLRGSPVVSEADEVATPPFEAAPFSLGLLWPFDEPNAPGEAPQT